MRREKCRRGVSSVEVREEEKEEEKEGMSVRIYVRTQCRRCRMICRERGVVCLLPVLQLDLQHGDAIKLNKERNEQYLALQSNNGLINGDNGVEKISDLSQKTNQFKIRNTTRKTSNRLICIMWKSSKITMPYLQLPGVRLPIQ